MGPVQGRQEMADSEDTPVPVLADPTTPNCREPGHGLSDGAEAPDIDSDRFGYMYHRLLFAADVLALIAGCGITLLVARLAGAGNDSVTWSLLVLAAIPVWGLVAFLFGLYGDVETRFRLDYVNELVPTVTALIVWSWFVALLGGVFTPEGPNLFGPAVLWLASIPLVLLLRALARTYAATRSWYSRSVALLGDQVTVRRIKERIERHPDWGISIELTLSRPMESDRWEMTGVRAGENGYPLDLRNYPLTPLGAARLVRDCGIRRVIVAGGSGSLETRTELVHTLLDRDVAVDYVTGGPETLFAQSTPQHLEGMAMMSVRPSRPGPLARTIKRVVDVVLSSALLVVAAPLLAFASIRIKRDSPGPVFFRQVRSGLREEPFEVIKLRTMYDGAHDQREQLRRDTVSDGNDDVLFKLDDDPRVTEVGRWLRRTSLDELPQLWNVLKGDMSMVGPRPLVPEEAEKTHGLYLARFRVKPGIAGPWQAEGRSEIPFDDMLKLDYSYVVGWSLAEDVRLLLRTCSAVIGRHGAK